MPYPKRLHVLFPMAAMIKIWCSPDWTLITNTNSKLKTNIRRKSDESIRGNDQNDILVNGTLSSILNSDMQSDN